MRIATPEWPGPFTTTTDLGLIRFHALDAACPSTYELLCTDPSTGSIFAEQLEYALVVICVKECDDPLDDWWHNYEQLTDPFEDNTVTFDLRMNDALHLDQEYCHDGEIVSAESRCKPHVGVTSVVSPFGEAPFAGGNPLIAVANLKSIYGVPRCHFTSRLLFEHDTGASSLSVDLATPWVVFDRIEVLWLSGHGGNSDPLDTPPLTLTTNGWSSPIGFLDKLTDWLDQGERVLVIDGHYLPVDFYAQLGLTTTIGGQQIPSTITPVTHPFTTGVSGSLVVCANHLAVRSLGVGAGGVMIGEGTDYLTLATFPAIVCESWPGNPTSRIIIWASYTDTPTAFSTSFTLQANRLSSAGNATFLRNFDTQRLVL